MKGHLLFISTFSLSLHFSTPLHGWERLFPVSIYLDFSPFTFPVQKSTKYPSNPLSIYLLFHYTRKDISLTHLSVKQPIID